MLLLSNEYTICTVNFREISTNSEKTTSSFFRYDMQSRVSCIFRRKFQTLREITDSDVRVFDYVGCGIECADINFDEDRWQPLFVSFAANNVS